jgi:hypothetical protein
VTTNALLAGRKLEMNDRMYYSKEAEQRARQQLAGMARVGMALGVGIGAVTALLFAPRTGDETRKALGEQIGLVYDNGREATGTALEALRKEFERLRSEVEERGKQIQS